MNLSRLKIIIRPSTSLNGEASISKFLQPIAQTKGALTTSANGIMALMAPNNEPDPECAFLRDRVRYLRSIVTNPRYPKPWKRSL